MITYIVLGIVGLIVLLILIVAYGPKPTLDEIHAKYLNDVGNKLKPILDSKYNNDEGMSYSEIIKTYNEFATTKAKTINEVKKSLSNPTPKNPKSPFVEKTKDYMAQRMDVLNNRYVYEKCAFVGLSPAETFKTHEIQIRDDEVYYSLFSGVGLYYEKEVTTSYNYGGLRMTSNFGGGLKYTSGNLTVMRNTAKVLDLVGSGDIYITNKRILFSNWDKGSNKSINLDSIINFEIFKEAVLLGVANGKKPFIFFPRVEYNDFREDEYLFVQLLTRIITGTIEKGVPMEYHMSEHQSLINEARKLTAEVK